MIKKIKIWHVVIAISVLLIFIRFNLLLNTFLMLYYLLVLSFSNISFVYSQLNFQLFDSLISITVIIIPFIVYFKRNKIKFLNEKADFTYSIIVLLFYFFVYAPLVANFNPGFQKNLSVTKLLPPFSSKKVLHLKQNETGRNSLNNFLIIKNKVIRRSFNESIILADSVTIGNNIIYYKNNQKNEIERKYLDLKNGKPYITTSYYLLGTDELGRDIFSRLVYGTRISLFVGLGSVVVAFILGLSLGFLAGFSGSFVNSLLNRISEMFLVFPILFLIIIILALFGNSLLSIIVVLGFSGWMSLFKVVRSEVISLKNKDFVITAKLVGLTQKDLLLKEILPVIIAPVIINLVFLYGSVILAEAALSYLGLGTGSIYPSWGSMIEAGQNYLSQAWWMIIFPGMFLTLTLYSANSLGKKLQTYYNPRLKQ